MAGLTKQHFKAIAEILNDNLKVEGYSSVEDTTTYSIMEDLATYFKTQNPLFDENQFKKACLK